MVALRVRWGMACSLTLLCNALLAGPPILGGVLPQPLPLFPQDNWWNLDISAAPVDANSGAFIDFINNGTPRRLHPDFGGDASPGSAEIYGFPFIVVDGDQPKKAVIFLYAGESDGVDTATQKGIPFYPIPDEAISQPHWIEGGPPGNIDLRSSSDRHMLIVDRDNRTLYELYSVYYDGSAWHAGSGAFFDMKTNNRRPDGWTSADAAGLAILPGLIRYDEVFGPDEIRHAFRVTVRATNGYVYPASHRAGSNSRALPMGARLRLKTDRDISGFRPEIQKIFRAMKKYGLIVADNGSDMYISGTYDTRWNNDLLNPAFASLTANDFEVVKLGYNPGQSIYFSQLAVGGGFSTLFTLGNSGAETASGNLFLTSQAGAPFAVIMSDALLEVGALAGGRINAPASSVAVSLPPGATKTIVATPVDPQAISQTGWARLETAGGKMNGVATFLYEENRVLKSAAAVLASQPAETATIAVDIDDRARRFTGLALANIGIENINIRLITVNEDGTVADIVAPAELNPLGPQRQIARFIHEYLPHRLKFRGSLVLAAEPGKRFVVTALIENQGRLTTVPVVAAKAPNVPN